MRRLIFLLLLLPLFGYSQTRQSGGISFTPQWNYKIAAGDTTWQFGNTLMSPQQFPYILTKWQSDQRYAPISGGGYVPNSRQIINGYGITGGHSLATDVTLATDTTHGSSGLLTWNYGLRFVKFGDTSSLFSNLVHKTGTETINGLKSFGNNSTWGTGNFVGTITAGYGNWYDNSGASTLQLTVRASSIQYNYGITNSTGLNFTTPTHSNSISFPDASGTVALKTDTGYFRTVANSMSLAQLHSNYQPLNAKLTSISALANSAGVLTNDGSGGFSYTTPGSGTVTAVSVALSNGFAGSSSGGATPSLTLSTTVTGIVKGNGTALSAAVSNTDYLPVTSPVMTGASTNNLSITGTSGTGFLNLGGTTSIAATPASGITLFSRSTNRLSLLGTNGFEALIGTTAYTVGHIVSLPDASGFLMTNPLTTTGDIPYLSASSSTGTNVARLAIGSAGSFLTPISGVPAWSSIITSAVSFQTPTGTADIDSIAVKIGSSGKMGAIAGNSYTNGSNVPYIVQPDNSTPEITPSALSSSSYRFTPLIKQFKSGKIILAYVDTTSHIAGRTIKIVYSTNGGATWTTPVVLVISSGVKYQNIGGGLTSTGRFIFAYTKIVGSSNNGVYGIYTDDEGATWSSESAIATGLKDAFGSLVIGANNKLMLPIYTEGGTTKSQIVNSTDNGVTWSSAVDVSDGISSENEASIAYLGGYTLLADVRQGTPNFFKQYISTDNGVTWVSQGVTTFGGSTQVSPWLDVWFAPSGRRMVTLYYSERSSGYIRAITASGQDLVANGVTAWNTSTLTNVATATTDGNSGYPSVIHPNNSAYALGVFYTGSSSVTAMTFFTYPPTGAQPLIYGDQNVSGGYNVNGININAIYAPIASPTFTGTVTIPTGGVFNTPASLVGTNITGTAAGLTAGTVTTIPNLTGAITSSGNATSLGSFSSANLLAALTTKTGTGNSVFSASPTFTGTSIFSNISPSGALNFTGAGTRPILLNGATTNFQYLEWVSTGAGLLMGINNSAGTSPVPSGSAYSSFWGTENATSADIITNQVARIDVSPTGVVSVLNLTTPGLVVTTTSGGALSTTTALPIGTTAAGTFNLKNYTVATLPAGTRGDIAYVTDALAPSFLTTVVGGGAVVTPVFFNGSTWVAQ